jgi:hypothetical protein
MAIKTRTQLSSESDSTFQDSPPANITPSNHRAFNEDCIDSFANLEDTNTFEAANTFQDVTTFEHRIDTSAVSVAAAGSMNLANVAGNYVTITGSGYTINSFGNAQIGAWRYLYFVDSGTITHGTPIDCPTGNSISVEAGDRALVIATGTNEWVIHNYQRASGFSLVQSSSPWTYATTSPNANDDISDGYLEGYRWIEFSSGAIREYQLNDESTGNAKWMPVAGTLSTTTADLQVAAFDWIGDSTPTPPLINSIIQYQLVGDILMVSGQVEIIDVILNNSNVGSGTFRISLQPNNQNLIYSSNGSKTAVGFGTCEWNNGPPPHHYSIRVTGDSTNGYINVDVATRNPHFGTGTIKIYFTAMVGVEIA